MDALVGREVQGQLLRLRTKADQKTIKEEKVTDIDIAALAVGEYRITNNNVIDSLCKRLSASLSKNKLLHVTVSESKKRTLTQNALFHVWCREIANTLTEIGAKEISGIMICEHSIKTFLKAKFLPTRESPEWDYEKKRLEMKPKPVSTKSLTRGEMHHFMTLVHDWCCSHSIIVSVPALSEYVLIEQEMNR